MTHRALAVATALGFGAQVLGCSFGERSSVLRVAHEFFAAAARGDSAALDSLVAEPEPRARAWGGRQHSPGLLATAAAGLEVENLVVRGDTVRCTLIPVGAAGREARVLLGLVRRTGGYKVFYFGVTD